MFVVVLQWFVWALKRECVCGSGYLRCLVAWSRRKILHLSLCVLGEVRRDVVMQVRNWSFGNWAVESLRLVSSWGAVVETGYGGVRSWFLCAEGCMCACALGVVEECVCTCMRGVGFGVCRGYVCVGVLF